MNYLRVSFLMLAAVFLISCSTAKPTFDEGILAGLETSACHGECPVFSVRILKNGLVEYEGHEFVAVKGKQSRQLTAAELKSVRDKLISIKFFQLKSELRQGEWGCLMWATDHSGIVLQASINGKKKQVYTYTGCESKQVEKVFELAQFLEEVSGIGPWINIEKK